jgi:hypothetical protein
MRVGRVTTGCHPPLGGKWRLPFCAVLCHEVIRMARRSKRRHDWFMASIRRIAAELKQLRLEVEPQSQGPPPEQRGVLALLAPPKKGRTEEEPCGN